MTKIREIELDILKPHLPNVLEFSQALADLSSDYDIFLDVVEMDEKTETLVVIIKGDSIDFPAIEETIKNLGASIHSIDKCRVVGSAVDD
jgi:hypothetical protein